jgi:hypothetical protein
MTWTFQLKTNFYGENDFEQENEVWDLARFHVEYVF